MVPCHLETRELASVLAGLRLLQEHLEKTGDAGIAQDVYDDGGSLEGLEPNEIEELCARLNSAEE